MVSIPLSGMEPKQEQLKVEDTLEPSQTLGNSEVVESGELKVSSENTTPIATTKKPSKKTLKNLDYPALRLNASLIVGSLGDWKKQKGARVKAQTVTLTQPNKKKYKAIQIFLAVDETDCEVVETPDGIEFIVDNQRLKVVVE